ncbi:MAG TPA: hypothetical protein VFK05_03160 [Polyangiaceae bacterium]|nr:hypothetical protein [Polyangiaceae bacterium]
MKFGHFEGRSSAWGSVSLLAASVLAASSGGCRLELSDGSKSGNGGEHSNPVATAADSGAKNTAGGVPSSGGGAPSNAQGGAANTAPAGGSSTGNASSAAFSREDCANPDQIANDDREHAVDFGSGATLCVKNDSDSDWFYVDTPSDGRAHVIQLDISETDGSWVDIYISAEKDGSEMGRIHPSQRGLKLSAFATVGPGTRTFFQVEGYVGNTDTTTIDVSVSPEADAHEPNNDRASATLIQPGSEVSAQLILPYVSQTDQQLQDFYKVQLAAGEHTFQMTAVPSDLNLNVDVSDSTGAITSSHNHGPNRGAKFSFPISVAEAGTYYFRVESWDDLAVVYSGTRADSYAQPYKFQID